MFNLIVFFGYLTRFTVKNDGIRAGLEEQSVMAEKDLLWFENNVVKCSECGKVLGVDDNGNYHNYCGELLCNDCAVTNDNGFICNVNNLVVVWHQHGYMVMNQ